MSVLLNDRRPRRLQGPALVILGVLMATPPAHGASQPNRLIREKSPYLLQHAENPVDWYPWGEEAFAKARAEQKPIFLSIGYSTCHWCHVMERESFESPAIAELLNRDFVSIKVDREEHPDVDQLYMDAVTAMTGHGGWPLTVFLTPEGKPFYGGTYFPPERRWNVPGLNELLPAIATAWREKREEVLASAEGLTEALQEHLASTAPPAAVTPALLDQAYQQAANAFDPVHGGFGEAPKFPRAHELSFLLHYWARTGDAKALEMVTTTLDRMGRGGLHDHLGGGFHRYSTDARWLVPHFEKMLYDQALLARAYLEAYRVTRRAEDAEVARGIFEYVLRDLADPQGGFYAAEDADSEGEEGKFYVWTPEKIIAALGPEEGTAFNGVYGVTAEGNFEGRSILHLEQPAPARLASARRTLLAARSRRVRPHRDDKVLTSWNGLMIASLAYGAATLEEPRYLEAATRAAEFILRSVMQEGRLLRRYRDGEARYPGTLEDDAFFAYGLLELYQASLDPRWLAQAKTLAAQMVEQFGDEAGGGFFLRAKDEEPLIVRAKELADGATPSGNSIAALVLLTLGRLTADASLEGRGRRLLEAAAPAMARSPFAYPQMLIAADLALGPSQEIVVAGDPADPQTLAMLRAIRERFLPRAVVVLHPPAGPMREAIEGLAPYAASQDQLAGRPTAYVCEHYVCNLPTTDLEHLGRLLTQGGGR